ncbi:MAG: hypothetical protein A3J29_20285 [Acidobacteria bacterium RIFCSPLOWO2_12_FULL_67_14b]|nr:MAG: hypothetical protein A3J29_20285 [Acidobacteria bacterium RIFCSPLOWO2_12_FULL_67_14b]
MRICLSVLTLVCAVTPLAADTPVTREQIEAFMRTAKVVGQRDTPSGVTRPQRLTLSDGTFKHDAVFQPIDERKHLFQPDHGKVEMNFVDSWKYNVAAARLAGLVGLADMMPVTIEYRHAGKTGALAWWRDSLMNEGERLKKKIAPPDPTAWNNDMFRQRVFMELVRDADRNLTNVLISPEWRVIMIDFTRAFRLAETIRPAELARGDRALLAKLEGLAIDDVTIATKGYLTAGEVNAVMKRRDLLVSHYRQLVQKLGEARVLY